MTHPAASLDDLVHQRIRLGALALLAAHGPLEFARLKEELALTDGNLSRHLRALESGRLVELERVRDGARARTRVSLSPEGAAALDGEVRTLRAILDLLTKKPSQPRRDPDAALAAPGAHIVRR